MTVPDDRPSPSPGAAKQVTEETAAPAAAVGLSAPRWRGVLGCIVAAAMTVLDLSMTSTALGGIQETLHASLAKGALVISAYATAELITLSLSAFLTRVFSPRTYLTLLVCVFVGGALLAASAWNFESLLLARVIQGSASGAIMPFAYYSIVVLLPGKEHPKAISTFSIMVTGSYVLAPILCITLAEWASWRALYCVAAPLGVFALWLALPGLREMRQDESPLGRRANLVSIGAAVVGLFCAQYALDSGQSRGWFASGVVTLMVVTAVVAAAGFVFTELRSRNPLVDLRLLRLRPFLASCVFNVVAGVAVYSAFVLIPFYLTSLGFSVGEIGTVSLYGGTVQLVIATGLPLLLRRVDAYLVSTIGAAVFALAALLPLLAGSEPPYAVIVLALMARSVGSGLLLAALGLIATRALRSAQASSGSLLFNMARSLGGSIGAACCAAFLAIREAYHVRAGDVSAKAGRALALHDVFAVAFGILVLLAAAVLIGYAVRRVQARRPAPAKTGA
ncbi:MFS transporter [Streptomyces sp. V3I7]|uniref:MFS transporter n=1 Tax=Streptomyces sp. V3I7 TaxID=3042278 RepID=UPI00277E569E|nr:MFS transporter [Streptomyces sp. V3I7]MDQ0993866.1 DHA2 family multidrug resistance protein [Streptomyces sp. V3I7]